MHPTLNLQSKPDIQQDDSVPSQLSTEKIQFKPKLITLSIISTAYKFPLNSNLCNDHHFSYASRELAP